MATFTLGIHNFEESLKYPVLASQFEDGTEQRRQVSANKAVTYTCTSPVLTEAGIDAYRAFYDARGGEYESFTWEGLTVRFMGPMEIEHHFDGWRASWTFKLVN